MKLLCKGVLLLFLPTTTLLRVARLHLRPNQSTTIKPRPPRLYCLVDCPSMRRPQDDEICNVLRMVLRLLRCGTLGMAIMIQLNSIVAHLQECCTSRLAVCLSIDLSILYRNDNGVHQQQQQQETETEQRNANTVRTTCIEYILKDVPPTRSPLCHPLYRHQ